MKLEVGDEMDVESIGVAVGNWKRISEYACSDWNFGLSLDTTPLIHAKGCPLLSLMKYIT